MRLARIDRYIYSQLLALFGFFALVLVAVYWVNRAVALFDQLIGDGQSALVFLEISALTLPNVVLMVLPIAAFAATVYAINRLTAESELVVMQATGFSALRMARPVMLFGLSVAAMMLVLSHFLVPESRHLMVDRRAEISENLTAQYLKEGQFLHPAPGVTLYLGRIADNGALENLLLADARNPGRETIYTAGRAIFVRGENGPKLIMINGMAQVLNLQGATLAVTRFADFTYDLGGLVSAPLPRGRGAQLLPTRDLLWPSAEILAEANASPASLLFEAHSRFADPFLALGAALIGFGALMQGSYSRFGLWRQIALAIVLMVLVQGLSTGSVRLGLAARQGWMLAYLAPALAAGAGLGLIWLSQRARRRRPVGAAQA